MNYSSFEEEITALKSIYGEFQETPDRSKPPSSGIVFDDKERSLKYISEHLDGILEVKISIPYGYPSEESSFSISSWYFDVRYLVFSEKTFKSNNIPIPANIVRQLKEIIETDIDKRSPILFELIDTLTSCKFVSKKEIGQISQDKNDVQNLFGSFDGENLFGILHGEPIVDRKSVFQAHTCKVETIEQVGKVIKWLLSNPKISKATHNIWAYRLFKDKNCETLSEGAFPIGYDIVSQDHNSDGENAAGGRLQHLLTVLNAKNVFVMVSRWYGGIQLGPDRFKHINNAARQILEKSGLIGKTETQNKSQSVKKRIQRK
ncbi:ximpact-like protein [Cryptosporidium canis]|uniref:Ximpact-like protein n=1 Tax=Cryptosporidium canis TaxID=195482 RepID=A0A9D5DH79_9CRYT|nr:ximpact-like protein [Cryptosporidium canis]